MSKLLPAAIASVLATVAILPYPAHAANAVGTTAEITAVAVAPAPAKPVKAEVGKNLYDASGKLIGEIYSVSAKGSVSVMLFDRIVTAPATSLSMVKNRITTSLTKDELAKR